jgi:hypothetical protein
MPTIGGAPIGVRPVGAGAEEEGAVVAPADFTYGGLGYTLSTKPWYPFRKSYPDSDVLESVSESGYIQSRARFTRMLPAWILLYKFLSETDRDTLESLMRDTKLADIFEWYNPDDEQLYLVRFGKPYPVLSNFSYVYWETELTLVQAI